MDPLGVASQLTHCQHFGNIIALVLLCDVCCYYSMMFGILSLSSLHTIYIYHFIHYHLCHMQVVCISYLIY